ncbi:hypothetical protein [Flammeovirga kamogawensis]|uniref:DUF4265 domain-containing protein n=1 Tax=Flammeovirga kamogawensis TaxID=373891 RepID=A0ABX8GWA6_9BACT|nr:hypothetical protein [Flammeovirga kamogawensis]MBB6460527.1 hypothetical protein [Flammeovirga kamogawensis]QWG07890.1 hypothetical protein KM029_02830 [Flammeovirga kamogawensis]TRX69696.1 hypothetical protein EO216_16760 [Flammeovirga kamogawensis]
MSNHLINIFDFEYLVDKTPNFDSPGVWLVTRPLNLPFFLGQILPIASHSFIYIHDQNGKRKIIEYSIFLKRDKLRRETDTSYSKSTIQKRSILGCINIMKFVDTNLTETIAAIQLADKEFNMLGLEYEVFIETPETEGNCHSAVSTILIKAGFPKQKFKEYDPFGANPGLGVFNPASI